MPGKLLRRPTSQRPRGPKSARKARRGELGAYRRGKIRPYKPKPIPALLRVALSPKMVPKRRKPHQPAPSAEELARRRTPATRAELHALAQRLGATVRHSKRK